MEDKIYDNASGHPAHDNTIEGTLFVAFAVSVGYSLTLIPVDCYANMPLN
jgi:hypothetical protein